jgi:hypothetical protein
MTSVNRTCERDVVRLERAENGFEIVDCLGSVGVFEGFAQAGISSSTSIACVGVTARPRRQATSGLG